MNQQLLIHVQEAIAEANTHAHISRYLPNLENENPGQCLLIYVTQPTADSEPHECLTVETPVEIGLRMMGGLKPEDIKGIFPLNEPDEAVCLLESLLDELDDNDSEQEADEA